MSTRGLGVLAKFPNVLPSTSITVNVGSESRNPSITYGIRVVLEYMSTERSQNGIAPAVMLISPVVVIPAGEVN